MFILAVIDDHHERQWVQELLSPLEAQIDFADSEEDLPELCEQTEPDFIILKAHYQEVSAKYLIKHFKPEHSDLLPEKFVILSNAAELLPEIVLSSECSAIWVLAEHAVSCILGEAFHQIHHTTYIHDQTEPSRILHITDDKLLQRIVTDLIHKETDYQIETASNGVNGLELYQAFHPNLVLTDWDLPDIDGIEVCRKIKIEYADSHTTVALFSSMTDEHLIESAYQAKAKAYIVKPVKPELLLSKIRKLLEATH